MKDKKLCKLVKDDVLEKALKDYVKLVADPTHLCTKCGRVCNDKKLLCKPEKLD
ncbi:MAG TPA: hypothetical protein VN436_17235 [Holophaga sp.]|nr:hypothetical protein [Holophaga sp.]